MVKFFGYLLILWCLGYFLTASFKNWRARKQLKEQKEKVAKYFQAERAQNRAVKYNIFFMKDYRRKIKKNYKGDK